MTYTLQPSVNWHRPGDDTLNTWSDPRVTLAMLCLVPGDEPVTGWWEPHTPDVTRAPVINDQRGYLFWLICNDMFLPPSRLHWSWFLLTISSHFLTGSLWPRLPDNCLHARISPDLRTPHHQPSRENTGEQRLKESNVTKTGLINSFSPALDRFIYNEGLL